MKFDWPLVPRVIQVAIVAGCLFSCRAQGRDVSVGGGGGSVGGSGDGGRAAAGQPGGSSGAERTVVADASVSNPMRPDVSVAGTGGRPAMSPSDAAVTVEASVCPGSGACKVMPLGDSITAGWGSTDGGGYRTYLFKRARSAGLSLTFVGNENSGPAQVDGAVFPRLHEGHATYTIEDAPGRTGITKLTAASLKKHQPHIVLLHIGTNDILSSVDWPNMFQRFVSLVELIQAAQPAALVVLAEIIPTTTEFNGRESSQVKSYNASIRALAAQKRARGQRVVSVDMWTPFVQAKDYRALMADNWHPSNAGHALMADVWFDAIRGSLR